MKKNQIILIIVGVLISTGLVLGSIYWLKFVKPKAEVLAPTIEELEKLKEEEFEKFKLEHLEETEQVPGASIKPIISCDEFLVVQGEISCQEAKETALREYPGKVYSIKKGGSEENQFWIISIQQKEKKIDVLIDMEGNIIRTII